MDTSRQTKNLNKLLIRILLHLQVEFSYQYNQENGNFTSSYDEDQIKGQVTKTTMTFIVGDDDEQITLNLNKK